MRDKSSTANSSDDALVEVIREVVKRCSLARVPVSEILAAFVVRTVVEANVYRYIPDRPIKQEDLLALVDTATDRLVGHPDDPALETIKMQVEFDSAYYEEEEQLNQYNLSKERKAKALQRRIAHTKPRHGTDFETLGEIYKDISQAVRDDHHPEGLEDKAIEQEIAAAIESVFPRIGVRLFTQLSAEDKRIQISEISNVVLGIRLLNKALGKGGLGISSIDQEVEGMASDLRDQMVKEAEFLQDLCGQYQETLVYAHLMHLQQQISAQSEENLDSNLNSNMDMIMGPDFFPTVDRLKDELANRRQFLSFLQNIQEDVILSSRRCIQLLSSLRTEMSDLKNLVSGRNTVPKEQVYPKFDSLAVIWKALVHEYKVLVARRRIHQRLGAYKSSFRPLFSSRLPLFQAAMQYNQQQQRQHREEPSSQKATQQQQQQQPIEREGKGGGEKRKKGKNLTSSGSTNSLTKHPGGDAVPDEEASSSSPSVKTAGGGKEATTSATTTMMTARQGTGSGSSIGSSRRMKTAGGSSGGLSRAVASAPLILIPSAPATARSSSLQVGEGEGEGGREGGEEEGGGDLMMVAALKEDRGGVVERREEGKGIGGGEEGGGGDEVGHVDPKEGEGGGESEKAGIMMIPETAEEIVVVAAEEEEKGEGLTSSAVATEEVAIEGEEEGAVEVTQEEGEGDGAKGEGGETIPAEEEEETPSGEPANTEAAAPAAVATTTSVKTVAESSLPSQAAQDQEEAGGEDDSLSTKPSLSSISASAAAIAAIVVDHPVRLSMEATPEFMQLPLEYQGFCAWTVLNKRGLLLPGRPGLGVIRYKSHYYVFASEEAIVSFMTAPDELISSMRTRALQCPELIHLLCMHAEFPSSSIRAILRGGKPDPSSKSTTSLALDGLQMKGKCDAETSTPVHFVTHYKDYKYEWNEWKLRHRALQIVKLRNCRTLSQQTDASHFRRQNTTQVYLPKPHATQTSQERGSNPPKKITYLAGLHHSKLRDLRAIAAATSDGLDPGSKKKGLGGSSSNNAEEAEEEGMAGVIQMTYEHVWEPQHHRRSRVEGAQSMRGKT